MLVLCTIILTDTESIKPMNEDKDKIIKDQQKTIDDQQKLIKTADSLIETLIKEIDKYKEKEVNELRKRINAN